MSWDRKKGGRAGGYFYVTIRTPDKPHPVKRYLGKGSAARQMAAILEATRLMRERTRRELAAERTRTAAADAVTAELTAAAGLWLAAWMALSGWHKHRGTWRSSRGRTKYTPC